MTQTECNKVMDVIADAKREVNRAYSRVLDAWAREPQRAWLKHETVRLEKCARLLQQTLESLARKSLEP